MTDDKVALTLAITFPLAYMVGFIVGCILKDMNESLECNVEVDGKVYECSTVPKISSDKVIKFRSGERRVEIPIDKEVIITLSK